LFLYLFEISLKKFKSDRNFQPPMQAGVAARVAAAAADRQYVR